jgi:hypothetical protein
MSGKAAQDKGKRAERSVVTTLQEICDRVSGELGVDNIKIQRNLQQSMDGGHDINVPWCAIEVKHRETLQLPAWWAQTIKQAELLKLEPVLIYKQNNIAFRVRLYSKLAVWNGATVRVLADIAWADYLVYFEQQARAYFAYRQGHGAPVAALRQVG